MSSTVESQGQARTNTGTCIVCYTHQHTIQIKILNSDNTGTYINTVRRSGTWQVMERGFKAAFCLFQFPAACCRIKICVQPSLLHHPDPGTSTHSRRINSFCKNTLEFIPKVKQIGPGGPRGLPISVREGPRRGSEKNRSLTKRATAGINQANGFNMGATI